MPSAAAAAQIASDSSRSDGAVVEPGQDVAVEVDQSAANAR